MEFEVIECDVLVIGGGPAGTSAAIHLARADKHVVVIDKATFPRDKCCGDGLTTAALRQLEHLGLDPKVIPSWRIVQKTLWRSPSGHTISLTVPDDDGVRVAVARREELDAAMVKLARSSGADVRENSAIEQIAVEGSHVVTKTSTGDSFKSNYVIAADGMWSPTRRLIDPQPSAYLGNIHAFRQYFHNVTGVARDHLWISFEPDLLPAYMWSFPIGNGEANVGFGIERKEGESVQRMKDVWPDILKRPHVRAALGENATPEGPHKAWPIPAHIELDLLSAANGRVLFVGDAARVVDPLTGEGIAQAMETAELAVRAILDSKGDSELAHKSYRSAIRFGVKIDNSFSRFLANLARTERGARAMIRLAPAGPWRGQYALRWVLEDNPRAGLLTPWRWADRFSPKTGAYK